MSDLQEDEMAFVIGRIAMKWNALHDIVRVCFPAVLGGDSRFTGAALDAIKSDDTQRKVILAVINSILIDDAQAPLLDKVNSLFNQIGQMAGERNGFLHTSWTRGPDEKIGPADFLTKVHGSLRSADTYNQAVQFIVSIDDALREVTGLIGDLQRATSRR